MTGFAAANENRGDRRPIGIFDSGVGGLSLLARVRALLPAEDIIYVADTAHLPYGNKTASYLCQRSDLIAGFLSAQDSKALVLACNTATAAAVTFLRQRYQLPIVGIEPAVKPATSSTRSGVVAILATASTLQSRRYEELLRRYGGYVQVINQACPGLVEQVERGELDSPATRSLLRRYIEPLLQSGVDQLVLGCTHYPFLVEQIREQVGSDVDIIDPGKAVVRRLAALLAHHALLAAGSEGRLSCYSSSAEQCRAGFGPLLPGVPVKRLPC